MRWMASIWLSTDLLLNAVWFVPNELLLAMSVEPNSVGSQVEPDGQSEHQPAERTLMSSFTLSRATASFGVVVATGVALKPASVRPLTIASLPLTLIGSSVRNRNLISYPVALADFSSALALAGSVSKPLRPVTLYAVRPGRPGGIRFDAGIAFTFGIRPVARITFL